MGVEKFAYWVTYRFAHHHREILHAEEMNFTYPLDTGDSIRRAQEAVKFSAGDSKEDAVVFLGWKRID
jgi:hypothetical protein